MEIKRIERGKYRGRLDLRGSMETMSAGECWNIPEDQVHLQTVRNAVSKATRTTDMVFTSRCPGLTFPFITITRIH